jgi:hypothetical protein
MEMMVTESVGWAASCPECGAGMECWGVQALVGDRLRWDVESACSGCGFAVAECGAEGPPAERREQLLLERGATLLQVTDTRAGVRVGVMRVVRVELGLDLGSAQVVAQRVLDGVYAGSRPEIERLARRLRASGIAADAVPAEQGETAQGEAERV